VLQELGSVLLRKVIRWFSAVGRFLQSLMTIT
jgi:hypothetical protein